MLDASTLVYVMDREAHPKGDKDADSVAGPEAKTEPEEPAEAEEEVATPTPSVEEIEATFVKEPSDMPVPQTMPLREGKDPIFPLPGSYNFGEPARQDQTFFTSSGDYSGNYSSAIIEDPATQGLITPIEEAASFEYLTQAPFPDASTAEHHAAAAVPMQHSVSQYDHWAPSFREELYSPLEYGSAAGHGLPEPRMHYPLGFASHPEEIHGMPDFTRDQHGYMEPMGSRGPLFRTGSLSHPHFTHSHQC